MSVGEWNLLLNVILVALAVVYGIWLKRVVDQQLKLKDATIESLRTQIVGLKAQSAPAIVR